MTKERYKENPFAFLKTSVFYQVLRKKISILPKLKGKKSVYTDKISMSGRSAEPPKSKAERVTCTASLNHVTCGGCCPAGNCSARESACCKRCDCLAGACGWYCSHWPAPVGTWWSW